MEINFEYHGVKASNLLESFTKEKLNNLNKKYHFLVDLDVYFKSENTTSDETGMIAGLNANIPGTRIHASHSSNSFENSISEAIRELEIQLQKKKEKMATY
ncbi:ribosome hibernation-promoting factor, HPF/YfiA family [Wenyingzhuangia sp. IMCC45533]